MLIQTAIMEDAAAILALQKLAYQSEAALYSDYSIPPLVQTLVELESEFTQQTILKMALDGQVIGSVRGVVREGTGYIGRLMVDPAFQHRGYGTLLMQGVEDRLRPVSRYELFTGHKSEGNIRLYEHLGYRIFRHEPAGDNLIMVYLEKRIG